MHGTQNPFFNPDIPRSPRSGSKLTFCCFLLNSGGKKKPKAYQKGTSTVKGTFCRHDALPSLNTLVCPIVYCAINYNTSIRIITIYLKNYEFTQIPPIPIQYGIPSSFLCLFYWNSKDIWNNGIWVEKNFWRRKGDNLI